MKINSKKKISFINSHRLLSKSEMKYKVHSIWREEKSEKGISLVHRLHSPLTSPQLCSQSITYIYIFYKTLNPHFTYKKTESKIRSHNY